MDIQFYWKAIQAWSELQAEAIRYIPRIIAVLIILLILRYIIKFVSALTHRVLERVELAQEAEDFIARSVKILTLMAGFIIILFVMGWGQLALSFVAGLGISGLVIGFALQDITKNLAAGSLLLFQRPFRIGDRIRVGSDEGKVEEISLSATILRTDDGQELMIPNATIYTGTIANQTRYKYRRFEHTLTLKADTPIAEATKLIHHTVAQIKDVVEELPIQVLTPTIKTEPIDVTIRFWLPSRYPQAPQTLSLIAHTLRTIMRERDWLA